jgi:hypothetical protein
LLKQIADRTGGRMLTEADVDLYHPSRISRESSRPVFDWFLLALCCLIPLDVGIRRVQLDWDIILGWFRPRKVESSGETMGALLQRKQLVKEHIDEQRAERPPPILPSTPAARPPRPPPSRRQNRSPPRSRTIHFLSRQQKRRARYENANDRTTNPSQSV